jgi:hypothetical protein
MHPQPREPHVAALVERIATRTPAETELLVAAMLQRSWPGGPSDRLEPAALDWVRRWTPRSADGPALECSCALGRCAVCN